MVCLTLPTKVRVYFSLIGVAFFGEQIGIYTVPANNLSKEDKKYKQEKEILNKGD